MNVPTHASRARPRSARLVPRRLARGAALWLIAMIAVFGVMPGTAMADNTVTQSEPADGAVLSTAPTQLVFTMAEEVGELRTVGVLCNAETVIVGPPTLSGNNRMMTVAIPESGLPKGVCVATWTVSNVDGETNGSGSITFQIETDPTPTTVPAEATTEVEPGATDAGTTLVDGTVVPVLGDAAASPDAKIVNLSQVTTGAGPLWLGRVLSTLGIAVVFGALVVIAAAWPEGVEYRITLRFLQGAWVFALIGTLLFTAAAASAVSGSSLGSGFNPGAWLDLVDAGWPGRAALLRMVLVIAMFWAAFRPDRVIDPVTQMAALGIPALAVVMIGVGRMNGSLAAVGVVLGVAHALAMAIWLGGVILLSRVILSGPGEEDLVHAVRGFARISVIAIAVTIGTGLAQMIRLDGGNLFSNGHGRATVLKVVLVAAMVFVGLSARQFAQQRLARAHEMTVPMADRLKRAFGAEAAIGLATLLVSAWLLALTPVNVNNEPTIDYAIERRIDVPDGENTALDVTVKLTNNRVGLSGLEVRVDAPSEGITRLEIVLTPPQNDITGGVTQIIPLTGIGRAVRSATVGLPLEVAGDWILQVNAETAAGSILSEPVTIAILQADGTSPTTVVTAPAPILVPIETSATIPT